MPRGQQVDDLWQRVDLWTKRSIHCMITCLLGWCSFCIGFVSMHIWVHQQVIDIWGEELPDVTQEMLEECQVPRFFARRLVRRVRALFSSPRCTTSWHLNYCGVIQLRIRKPVSGKNKKCDGDFSKQHPRIQKTFIFEFSKNSGTSLIILLKYHICLKNDRNPKWSLWIIEQKVFNFTQNAFFSISLKISGLFCLL